MFLFCCYTLFNSILRLSFFVLAVYYMLQYYLYHSARGYKQTTIFITTKTLISVQ